MFELQWTAEARKTYNLLKNDASQKKRYKAVKKTLNFLAMNPRHNSLQTHEYMSLCGPNGEKIFEAYVEQKTPAAYRVFLVLRSLPGRNHDCGDYASPLVFLPQVARRPDGKAEGMRREVGFRCTRWWHLWKVREM